MNKAKDKYKRQSSKERLVAFMEEVKKFEKDAELCPRCDGRGINGCEMRYIDGIAEPDYSKTLSCKVCGGYGYVGYR